MKKNKLLLVYNTCGILDDKDRGRRSVISKKKILYYITAIKALINQDLDNYKVVVSMYKSSLECKKQLAKKFGNKISYIFYDKGALSVNHTFNKTIQLCVEKFGKFEGYLYIDSGVHFGPIKTSVHPVYGSHDYPTQNTTIVKKMYDLFKDGPYAMVDGQVDWDAGFEQIGFDYDSGPPAQIQGENVIIPVGKAVNMHIKIYSHELYENYDRRVHPDVFAAFCSESVLSFLAAAIKKKWAVLADEIVHHFGCIEAHDGSNSADFHKKSPIYNNAWNNLLHGRNALDFINDQEAIDAGLGYEEINNIMMHKQDAFDEEGFAKNPEKLREIIMKYFFLTKEEFDYDKIKYNLIWGKN
jgi:hypothetical protein|tara:strand:- start:1998 stop:3062 length:1065 start_codon:yes stop_codon:yes gene_type:complete